MEYVAVGSIYMDRTIVLAEDITNTCTGREPRQNTDGSWPRDYCGADHDADQPCL